MAENKTETKITMLTIKEAAELVQGLTEFRVRELCRTGELPCIMAGKKIFDKQRYIVQIPQRRYVG